MLHPVIGGIVRGPESSSESSIDSTTHRILELCALFLLPLIFGWTFHWFLTRRGSSYTVHFEVLLLCWSWMACSIGMHTLNKELVTLLKAPSTITIIQMGMAAFAMFALNRQVVVEAFTQHPQQFKKWLIVPVIFSGILLSSFFTYTHVTLCVMTVVRNLGPLIALPIEMVVMPGGKKPFVSMEGLAAMLMMLLGAIVYAAVVPSISMIGIAFAVLNLVIAVIDRTVHRRLLAHDCKDLKLEFCTFINNFVGMLPAVGVALFTRELQHLDSRQWIRTDVLVLLVLSGFVGLGISYLGLAVQKKISATSFLVMQNVSKVFVVAIGIGLFGDPIKSYFIVLGLFLSLAGSFWYGKAQLANKPQAEKTPLLPQTEGKTPMLK